MMVGFGTIPFTRTNRMTEAPQLTNPVTAASQ